MSGTTTSTPPMLEGRSTFSTAYNSDLGDSSHKNQPSRDAAPRFIEAIHTDSVSGDVVIECLHLKQSWHYRTLEDRSNNVVIVPEESAKPKRCRLAFMPVAKELQKFSSTRELCEAMSHAVQAHEDLYSKAGILHGDIAPFNIGISYQ
ncbi:unnamed protein product [Peniophora sp. CBMAI 1063]|nr:unnamed protein product [Peniophora sp. CBMAI 1063]